MNAPIAIPNGVEGVTAEWLTAALQQKNPGLRVEQATLLESLGGACTKLRVAIRTNQPDFPETVIVKGCLEQNNAEMLPMQYLEALIYGTILPSMESVETIQCYFVQADEELGSALVMEDLNLRGVICRNALDPIESYDLAANFLDSLAHLHSRWWAASALSDESRFAGIRRADELLIPRSEEALSNPEVFDEVRRKPRMACLSRKILDAGRFKRAFEIMKLESRALPWTITHGDMHPSNLFTTADGKGGLFDWTSLRAPWAQDVSYFLGGNLDPVDRRDWEKPLLQYYLSRLSSLGVSAPRFEDAWYTYRSWMLWGAYVWLFNIPEYHSEEKITAMTARFGAAILDHGTLDLVNSRALA